MLSFVAGLVAGPLLGIDPSASGKADAATTVAAPAVVAVATPTATSSMVPAVTPAATPAPTPAPKPCKGVKDTRSATAKKTPFTVCGIELVSKNHRVSSAYAPKLVTVAVRANGIPEVLLQPRAGTALKKMFAAAARAGHTLVVLSSYRSYATQAHWYATMNKRLTAPAGASEHQTGLAVDLAGVSNGVLVRGSTLARSPIGAWLVKNAPTYGFILRYPSDQAKITGIVYEPWHFRYVGVDAAKGVVSTRTETLEEYLKES